jgi:hypothetical protein
MLRLRKTFILEVFLVDDEDQRGQFRTPNKFSKLAKPAFRRSAGRSRRFLPNTG